MAVLGFRNLAADRDDNWLSTALSEMLLTELSAGAKVRMVASEEVVRVKRTFSLPYTEDLKGENLQQLRGLLGADLVVVGSFLAIQEQGGRRLRIDLRVVRVPEGDTVVSFAEVGTEDGLFELVPRIGRRLRHALGWSEPSPADARAAAALQPGSPEAAHLYAEGLTRLRAFDSLGRPRPAAAGRRGRPRFGGDPLRPVARLDRARRRRQGARAGREGGPALGRPAEAGAAGDRGARRRGEEGLEPGERDLPLAVDLLS